MYKYPLVAIGVLLLVGALYVAQSPRRTQHTTLVQEPHALRYLPLGDSYTIGQSVSEQERWPNQLVAQLDQDGVALDIVANPSVTGFTTQSLIERELPLMDCLKPDFVTVQIGVNDYVQGVPIDTFHEHLTYILDAVQSKLANPKLLVLVTIPDYGKTPTGAQYGEPAASEKAIKAFNAIIIEEATKRALPVADIFAVSQKVTADKTLTADDGLHPSGKQYAEWTRIIYAAIKQANVFTPSAR